MHIFLRSLAILLVLAGSSTYEARSFAAGPNLYVSNESPSQILVFAPTRENGDMPPIWSIAGSKTHLKLPQALAFGPTGELFVANNDVSGPNTSILVFAPHAKGNVAPIRWIHGAATMFPLNIFMGIDVDKTGRLYAAMGGGATPQDGSPVFVFAAGANGNTAPIHILVGPSPTINNLGSAGGLAIDTTAAPAKALVLSDAGIDLAPPFQHHRKLERYSLAASGPAQPVCVIRGPLTGMDANQAFAGPVTVHNGDIWAQILGPSPTNLPTISGFHGCGNIAPVATLAGSNTGFDTGNAFVSGLVFDKLGHLYVSDYVGNPNSLGSVQIFFGPNFNGNIAPDEVLHGPKTKITYPMGIAIGP